MYTEKVNAILDELLKDSWSDDIKRHRSDFVFRGLSDFKYDLAPTIARFDHYYLDKKMEYHLLRSFRKYSAIDSDPGKSSLWRQIAIAQHHRLPTRLLDWTFSPFVALHFATYDLSKRKKEIDSVVWCVNIKLIHELLPEKLRNELDTVGNVVFSTRMLDRILIGNQQDIPIKKQLEEFEALGSENKPFAVFFEPPSLDDRIVNQYALFSAMSQPSISLDEWLRKISLVEEDQRNGNQIGVFDDGRVLFKKIRIPYSLKWEIRNRLDQSNINERILFPGLDGLAEWLKRYYGPGPDW